MTIHLDLEDLLHVAERTLATTPLLRDPGLLEAAAARPRTTVFGEDAYPDLASKGAALLESLVLNHPLVDGNKRLGLAALTAFLGLNGHRLTWSNDQAFTVIMAVASGELHGIDQIAAMVRAALTPW